ncbi:MAG: hypothetical protein DMF84_31700 [Acidobacteria bacterium]|nr:MAG: hypothetical protein DMF84_31700 [Acidobacteriota bacterium]
MLCAVSQPEAIAVAAAMASARTRSPRPRCAASTSAGQKPIRNTAAWAFGYEIGKESLPE